MRKFVASCFVIVSEIFIVGCQSKNEPNIKNVQEKIAVEIEQVLEQNMAEMGLSQVKLKNAPKTSGNKWEGTVTFESGSGKFDQRITADYDGYTNTVTWWYSDDLDNMFDIFLGDSSEQLVQNNTPEQTIQTVQSSTINPQLLSAK
jgi:hypothetical protein